MKQALFVTYCLLSLSGSTFAAQPKHQFNTQQRQSVPELDPTAGATAVVFLVGALALMLDRRRTGI